MPLYHFGKTEEKYSLSDHYAGHLYSAYVNCFSTKLEEKKVHVWD